MKQLPQKRYSTRTDIQKHASNQLLQHAVFRWESAVVLGGTMLLTAFQVAPFVWWPIIGWPILGAAGLGAIIYSSLSDKDANAKVLQRAFQEQFDPAQIVDRDLREDVETALEYQRRIEDQIARQKEGPLRLRLETTAGHISDWISNVHKLAVQIDVHRKDDLLVREMRQLPQEIDRLVAQRRLESNPTVQKQLDEVIASKDQHGRSLVALDDRMKQAQLQMEQSITALATIYSQVQLVGAQSTNRGQADRLQLEIQDQVERMDDLVESISEVYSI